MLYRRSRELSASGDLPGSRAVIDFERSAPGRVADRAVVRIPRCSGIPARLLLVLSDAERKPVTGGVAAGTFASRCATIRLSRRAARELPNSGNKFTQSGSC